MYQYLSRGFQRHRSVIEIFPAQIIYFARGRAHRHIDPPLGQGDSIRWTNDLFLIHNGLELNGLHRFTPPTIVSGGAISTHIQLSAQVERLAATSPVERACTTTMENAQLGRR